MKKAWSFWMTKFVRLREKSVESVTEPGPAVGLEPLLRRHPRRGSAPFPEGLLTCLG